MNQQPFGKDIPLGKQSESVSVYTPSLLCGVPRSMARAELGLEGEALPFIGVDLWNAYEMSWLNQQGKPEIAVVQITVPCTSEALIESKSLKLYLNSFSQTQFRDSQEIVQALEKDLSETAQAPVLVDMMTLEQLQREGTGNFPGTCVDNIDAHIDVYSPDSGLLLVDDPGQIVQESLVSHLLRSTCPVTGQPDWGSVQVKYSGPPINHESLLKYIVSFREHQGFHEQCIEKIYLDILQQCRPQSLTVYGRFLRRGGIDINPYRTNTNEPPDWLRLVRQ